MVVMVSVMTVVMVVVVVAVPAVVVAVEVVVVAEVMAADGSGCPVNPSRTPFAPAPCPTQPPVAGLDFLPVMVGALCLIGVGLQVCPAVDMTNQKGGRG